MDRFAAVAERQAGWSPYTTIYLPFAEPLDTAALPATPAAAASADSLLRLVDVDPSSPERGRRVPLRWRYVDGPTSMLAPHTLAVRPRWGDGMRAGTAYVLTIDGSLACTADGGPVRLPITTSDVPSTLAGMIAVAREALPAGPVLGRDFVVRGVTGGTELVGRLDLPRWQSGEVPYLAEGGDIARDEAGRPLIDGFDDVPIGVMVPPGDPPAAGWPVVVYLNGTGSTYDGLFDGGFGARWASLGLASVAIDLPLHGERGVGQDPSLTFVNINNPVASVHSTLQGAADQVWLVDLLARPGALVEVGDTRIPLDPSRIAYFGHSQGGITGALAAGHFDGKVSAAMLSGTGGGVMLGALLNESGFDYAAVVASLLGFADGEELDEFHPVSTLIQHAGDATDPLYTAPHWFARPGLQQRPLPAMFLSLGTADRNTAPISTHAMATAAGLPVARPVVYRGPSDAVQDPPPARLPLQGNLTAFDGTPVTAGLVQYRDGAHGVVIREDFGRVERFFVSALVDGAPVLD